jgi:phage-related protein
MYETLIDMAGALFGIVLGFFLGIWGIIKYLLSRTDSKVAEVHTRIDNLHEQMSQVVKHSELDSLRNEITTSFNGIRSSIKDDHKKITEFLDMKFTTRMDYSEKALDDVKDGVKTISQRIHSLTTAVNVVAANGVKSDE